VRKESIMVRTYRSAQAHREAGSMAIIIWPLEPYSGRIGESVCWHRTGQHGGCYLPHIVALTRPATAEEAAEAIAQWRGEGPGRTEAELQFVLLRRSPAWHVIMAKHREDIARRKGN
jgi:hypothetical protein